MTFSAGIARRVDAGLAAKGIHLKTCIVGEAVVAVFVANVAGFLKGICLQCGAGFGNVVVAADVAQRQHFYLVAQNLPDFGELVGIVGGEDYLHG